MYEGVWQDVHAREGDPDVIQRPEDYAPFPYRRDHLIFMKMDGRRLAFRDGTFDVVYSLSSIEHFGGMPARPRRSAKWPACSSRAACSRSPPNTSCTGPPHEETFQPHEFAQSDRSTGPSARRADGRARCTAGTSTRRSISTRTPTRRRTWWCASTTRSSPR